jgi:hypothetical protein
MRRPLAAWERLCSRCSQLAKGGGSQLCRQCYDERCKAVYWRREPACNVKGPDKAQCLLSAGHEGMHEGNGYDDWGPVGRTWTKARNERHRQRQLARKEPA